MAKKQSTAVAATGMVVGYPVLAADGAKVGAVVKANLGGGGFSPFDLERIRIPAGGGKTWTIPGLAGDETAQIVRGIIVHFEDVRAYWSGGDVGNNPPDCSSSDMLVGRGEPGGECAKCPYSQWDSGRNERGQACKCIRRLFLLREQTYLPALIALPPTSLKSCRQYLMRITNAALPYWRVVTELGLEQMKNPDGVAYSHVLFTAAQHKGEPITLTHEEGEHIRKYAEGLRAALAGAPVTSEDYVITTETE